MNFDRNKVEMVKKQYPVGTRIRLNSLCNDEHGMPAGLCGTVVGVDDQPKVYVQIGISERGKAGAWSGLHRCEMLAGNP